MRIAVLFYGRINKAKDTHKNIVDAIGPENTVDYFLSTGEESTELVNTFIELYNPIAYTNEEIHFSYDIPPSTEAPVFNCRPYNMICSFINKERVFSLFEAHANASKIEYDVVFSLRCDILFEGKVPFLPIQDDAVYIPICYNGFTCLDMAFAHANRFQVMRGITDSMAYGNASAMKKYSSLINNFMYLLHTDNCAMHPEILNYVNIIYNNLDIERFNLDFDIVR